ncbi:PTS sugar transporter subunit IIB [Fonticella tunisiensis]|uniref:PTS system galactitol-specific IIB component n=1 Tax=Fonticella tunisiensis TaxID=1096341 RepID=A0A4R7KXD4_9CLOT|nr:PTS sugar transporter subunit IIB [Fonticella tunisiensis]TDT63606.1 PTS system galactitol-specific IIB component [Fonticella tunisiensis]
MKKQKEFKTARVMVVCADGVATSTMVLVALRDAFEDAGISAEFVQGRVIDAPSMAKNGKFDFIISTAGTDLDLDTDIPVFSGVPILTGIGKEQMFEKIMELIG